MKFVDLCVLCERLAGSSDTRLAIEQLKAGNSVDVYREQRGRQLGAYYIGLQRNAKDPRVAHIVPNASNSVFEVTCTRGSRTDMMHLFRFKYTDVTQDLSELSRLLSNLAVDGVSRKVDVLVKQTHARLGDRLKIVHPASHSPFNTKVAQKIQELHPDVKFAALEKTTLEEIEPNTLFPRKGAGAINRGERQRDYINTLYTMLRANHPHEEFSRERIARELAELNRELQSEGRVVYDPASGIVSIDGKTAAVFAKHSSSEFDDLMSEMFNRASDHIVKTQAKIFRNVPSIQPNDMVLFYDDNVSQGFTQQQVRSVIESQGARVLHTIFGITIKT